MPATPQSDVLRGAVDLLALKALAPEPMHGWGIGQRIQDISGGELAVAEQTLVRVLVAVNQGSLYPALQRLEHRGLITSEWGTTENGRRARYYRLTAAGRRALGEETVSWRRFAAAVETVLAAP